MKYILIVIIALLCSSCATTVVVNGVAVKSPQRATDRRTALVQQASFFVGFAVGCHWLNTSQKNMRIIK